MPIDLIDLSQEIEEGMVTYPGLPGPVISEHLGRDASRERYGGLAEFHIGKIEMVANTGTYLDAPFHRFADGVDVGQLALDRVAFLPGLVVRLPAGKRALTAQDLSDLDLRGRALLVHTGWSKHWRTAAYGGPEHPFVSRDAAQHAADAGVALVGIDSVNIDDMADMSRPAHTILLRHGIPIVEHLTNLSEIGERPFSFFAVPARVRRMGTFTVRAFAAIDAPSGT